MIVETHSHIGDTNVFDVDLKEEDLLATFDANGVDIGIVMPSAGCASAPAIHDRIAKMGQQNPGRIYGMIQINPHTNRQEYEKEAERCVRELGFVGVKIHPLGYGVSPRSKSADMVFQVARDLEIPVMIHTGSGIPWALPSLWIPLAQRYPQVSVILAHAGMGVFSMEATLTANLCPNVYLETSWAKPGELLSMIREVGAHRVMMGGDLMSNLPVEIFKYRSIGLTPEEQTQCLARTAIQVFKLPVPLPESSKDS